MTYSGSNVHCLPDVDLETLAITKFDGKSPEDWQVHSCRCFGPAGRLPVENPSDPCLFRNSSYISGMELNPRSEQLDSAFFSDLNGFSPEMLDGTENCGNHHF